MGLGKRLGVKIKVGVRKRVRIFSRDQVQGYCMFEMWTLSLKWKLEKEDQKLKEEVRRRPLIGFRVKVRVRAIVYV